MPQYPDVNLDLQLYVEKEILPLYDDFDKAHRRDHVLMVIEQSLDLARKLCVDLNMAYTIAAYHDTGLCEGRNLHHEVSAHIILSDPQLHAWFSSKQIQTMAEAAEDHRASAKNAPRSIYGRIVAEADRFIDPFAVAQRTVQYGLDHYPELGREEQYCRMVTHLKEKYGRNGYLKLWFSDSPNAERLERLRDIINNETMMREIFEKCFDEMTGKKTPRTIRHATIPDIPNIMPVLDEAREKMQASGNLNQWINGYPSMEVVQNDIERQGGFVIEDDGQVVGYFALLPSPEPTYGDIFGGQWLDDTLPYHVIHRIGSKHGAHGIFNSVMKFAFARDTNIRIDTHRDNVIMQHNLNKHGFRYCGIIYLLSGDERLAFQKICH